ncbi:hypothetical protein AMS68_000509 [Peltaster fructicola]|uniref:Kinesin-like protein n=1 Tax=Peltaster fructicola TaxID=286661 RepID=A0A6H0XJV0_9PEZI|nr:hypothetical protein AMS68_000509 [Peltaster fructicola]
MFLSLRKRSDSALDDIYYELSKRTFIASLHEQQDNNDMAGRALTTPDLHAYQPTTSLARLRGGEPFNEALDSRPSTPLGADAGNVKVVVRVRKFVKRELDKQLPCIIRMNASTQETRLLTPVVSQSDLRNTKKYEERSFTFDKSFWSHDEEDAHFAHQQDIYASFGEEFLDHNFDGYHTCIFAYGQTGSGKSYTMMGTQDQPGLIPRTCSGLFERIESEQNSSITYKVHVSYFEIYNERVKDLLAPKADPPTYLKIRESKADGVYVQNLTDEPVKCYEDIERLMKIGDLNRTTAATKMNDTSSRSHAVFTLTLKQIQHDLSSDSTIERLARMRLVDLAGSERAGRTEATGQRLREGGNINQSLTTLGRVIAALADPNRHKLMRNDAQNTTKRRAGVVPYRDSVLTWILKESLGGNSKTAMVACISPTDYEETLSTLRYADQAKRIRTRATVNQDSLSAAERDAKIIEMQETIKQLQLSVNAAATRKRDEADRARDELEDYQRQVSLMQRAMEENRAVSEVKIRALTMEVDELRPQNQALRLEVEALRRHLALAVGELKNPIIVPKELRIPREKENYEPTDDGEDDGSDSGMGDSVDGSEADWEGAFDHDDVQAELHGLLSDLSLFKKKVQDDKARFPYAQQDV